MRCLRQPAAIKATMHPLARLERNHFRSTNLIQFGGCGALHCVLEDRNYTKCGYRYGLGGRGDTAKIEPNYKKNTEDRTLRFAITAIESAQFCASSGKTQDAAGVALLGQLWQ